MRRSAIWTSSSAVALLLLFAAAACGPPEPGQASAKAQDAWKLYISQPNPNTYENFIRANRLAASLHAMPHDRVGVEYQLRALEVQAAEAERAHDLLLADDVTERVDDIERHDLGPTYDEVCPGAKARLADAKARAARVSR